MAGIEIATRALLLDIEGTTTPISFISDVLFPYARRHGRQFILDHVDDQEIQKAIRELQTENASDRASGAPPIEPCSTDTLEQTIRYYLWLIDADRKATPLKTIQGRIWKEGYAKGALQSIVFPDVLAAFARWRQKSRIIAIYSSGSVLAQQQLFRHTNQGDLTPSIDAYFDTRTGAKTESLSYTKIASGLYLPPGEILFISDVVMELDAARAVGMRTALCVRLANVPRPQTTHPFIHSFDEVP